MRACIITFNIHNICFVGWRDSLLVLFVICSNYALFFNKEKKTENRQKKTWKRRWRVIYDGAGSSSGPGDICVCLGLSGFPVASSSSSSVMLNPFHCFNNF